MKKALITGITGQDGSYLAELLLSKGYEVHGIVRRSSTVQRARIDHLAGYEHGTDKRLYLHYGDLSDSVALVKLLYDLTPDEIYNLAAQSHVRVSFDIPEYTLDVTGVGAGRILEAVKEAGIAKKNKILPSLLLRDVRQGAGDSPERNDTLLAAFPLRLCESHGALAHGELPRGLRHSCLQWHSFQS